MKLDNLLYGLIPRNKASKGNTSKLYYWSNENFIFDASGEYKDENSLRFLNFLKCYADRNKEVTLKGVITKDDSYWRPYISAKECRDMVKFFRDAKERGTIYYLEKPFCIKNRWDEIKQLPSTMLIMKRAYTEEALFMKALCNDGIRSIDKKEMHFFSRLMIYMDNAKGVWIMC